MAAKKIKELEKEIRRLRRLVVKDEVTDALNRRGFYEKISEFFNEVLYFKKEGRQRVKSRKKFLIKDLSILFIDLDGLKRINDIYGHRSGDKVIKITASIIKKHIRESDFVGRWGGDEFLVCLVGSSEKDAYNLGEKIREAVKREKGIRIYKEARVTLSIGVAEADESILSIDDLIERTDKAMYEAKNRRGKDNTARYSEIASK